MMRREKRKTTFVPRLKSQKQPRRNSPCPCGSGKKFKKCCLLKQWEVEEQARQFEERRAELLHRMQIGPKQRRLSVITSDDVVPVEASRIAEEHPDMPQADARQLACAAMLESGTTPANEIWAYFKTGVYLTDTGRRLYGSIAIEEWTNAVAEFDTMTEEQRNAALVRMAGGEAVPQEILDE